ncbi:hypothetical protein [Caenimonas koreensis]|uniref:hypothetical protein n=1 Tax=Caenimonas koreensis TaxID=367474 RepID=UPI00188F079E|nr:hypothetical protein [Caenimonas koreensis]
MRDVVVEDRVAVFVSRGHAVNTLAVLREHFTIDDEFAQQARALLRGEHFSSP